MENLIAVIITTNYRGVFYGWINPDEIQQKTLKVEKCRNVRFWTSKTNGFQGLSSNGPKDCTISALAGGTTVIHEITSITTCSNTAIEEWEKLK